MSRRTAAAPYRRWSGRGGWLRIAVLLLLAPAMVPADEVIRIGVLSHRGDPATATYWADTAAYLSDEIPGRRFEIVPLDFDEVEPAVESRAIHFLLVNPSIYVVMEVRHRVARIATLNRRVGDDFTTLFGSVVFTRADRDDIASFDDLRHKTIMAVDKTSLGGYQMTMYELKSRGMGTWRDGIRIRFGGIHDNVVEAVYNGSVDVGTVRTGILESMDAKGKIDMADFKIINERHDLAFPEKLSTRLYPEWPFSKLNHTPDGLAQAVAIALMQMHQKSGRNDRHDRWSIPLEYQPVHDLLKALHLPPYDHPDTFTLADAINKYWAGVLASLLVFVALMGLTIMVIRLNRALRLSKSRLERQHSLILNSVADGIYGVDLDGNSTFVNKAMEEMTGWKAEEIIGLNHHALIHHTTASGEPFPEAQCPVYKTYADSKKRVVDEDVFWKKDGSSFPVTYVATPLKDERNRTIGSVVVFRDISQQKRLEANARRHQQELAHVTRVSTMGEMASGIAHELNQPLTAISTNALACIRLVDADKINPERIKDILERINNQAQKAGGIIKQLRAFVKKGSPKKKAVDINTVVRDVVVLIEHTFGPNDIELKLALAPDLPAVYAQDILIDQVLVNLIKNSIEAMTVDEKREKSLTIRTEMADAKTILVTVADTGPGIDEEIRSAIFSPYVSDKENGMGLGLSISQRIIAEHGGTLYLDETSASGTTFKFTLPIHRETDHGG